MARTRRQVRSEAELRDVAVEEEKARASSPPPRPNSLVQTALAGEVGEYISPNHADGESFPGRQPSTTQLSLFETGFKRKSGQASLFETGFKRRRELVAAQQVCC